MPQPTTPVEHEKVATAIDDRLTRVWEVYNRVRGEAFNLSILAFIHYVQSVIPDAQYIALEVTDQGGDTMTFQNVGITWDAWKKLSTEDAGAFITVIDGVDYVPIDSSDDLFEQFDEDTLVEYAMSVEDYQLVAHPWFERTGNRHSGQGRLWIAPALEALNDTYEGFIGEALDPFPNPNDPRAVAAWLARETAPTEET